MRDVFLNVKDVSLLLRQALLHSQEAYSSVAKAYFSGFKAC